MKRGGGAPKGKRFERQVAKMVTAAFKDFGIRDIDCFRTPLSGGHIYARKTDPGDLVISKKLRRLFPFHVECKHYGTVNVAHFLRPVGTWKKSWNCARWMKQIEEAKVGALIPLLVFKENFGEILAAYPEKRIDVRAGQFIRFVYNAEPWRVIRMKKLLQQLQQG